MQNGLGISFRVPKQKSFCTWLGWTPHLFRHVCLFGIGPFWYKVKIASKSTTLQWPNFVTHQNESTKSSKGKTKVYKKWCKDWIGKKRISLFIKIFHNRKINKGIEHGHSIMTLSNSDLEQLPPFLSLAINAFHWMNWIFLHFDCILIFRCFVTCMIKQPTFYLVLIQVQMYGRAEELKMREGEEEGRGERGEGGEQRSLRWGKGKGGEGYYSPSDGGLSK